MTAYEGRVVPGTDTHPAQTRPAPVVLSVADAERIVQETRDAMPLNLCGGCRRCLSVFADHAHLSRDLDGLRDAHARLSEHSEQDASTLCGCYVPDRVRRAYDCPDRLAWTRAAERHSASILAVQARYPKETP